MRKFRPGWAALAAALLGSCAPRPAPPAPAPAPAPPPPPVQPPAPPPIAPGWEDAPLSGGDWSFGDAQGRSRALFGAQFAIECEAPGRIRLVRAGAGGNALTVRTSNALRSLPAAVQSDGLAARLSAGDPLLDAIAFSRGRFAVEAAGVPPLVLPAWPEPARVVEDCRG